MDAVYATTWDGMITRSERYWARFPEDRASAPSPRKRLRPSRHPAPPGRRAAGWTTSVLRRPRPPPRRLPAGRRALHYLLNLDPASTAFLHDLAEALPFGGRNPLYAVIHESCWADGVATRWTADRMMPDAVREDPTLLAGEHVHRDLFAEDPELAPWAEAADLLAEHEWPRLYDEQALRAADVPGAAAVYFEDAYVPRQYSLATAEMLSGVHPWVTSEYEHNGLRASGQGVIDHLLDLATGRRAA